MPTSRAYRPDLLLHLEGLAAFIILLIGYRHSFAGHWGILLAFFLVPDAVLVLYASGKTAAWAPTAYNVVHSYVCPGLLAFVAYCTAHQLLLQIALIWGAHIAFDRALGYGLKVDGFKRTHIQCARPL